MSKPNFLLCDVCGAKLPEQASLFIATGTSFDGVESQTDGKHVDLCHVHLHAMVKAVLKRGRAPDYDLGKRLIDWYDKARTKSKTDHTPVCW